MCIRDSYDTFLFGNAGEGEESISNLSKFLKFVKKTSSEQVNEPRPVLQETRRPVNNANILANKTNTDKIRPLAGNENIVRKEGQKGERMHRVELQIKLPQRIETQPILKNECLRSSAEQDLRNEFRFNKFEELLTKTTVEDLAKNSAMMREGPFSHRDTRKNGPSQNTSFNKASSRNTSLSKVREQQQVTTSQVQSNLYTSSSTKKLVEVGTTMTSSANINPGKSSIVNSGSGEKKKTHTRMYSQMAPNNKPPMFSAAPVEVPQRQAPPKPSLVQNKSTTQMTQQQLSARTRTNLPVQAPSQQMSVPSSGATNVASYVDKFISHKPARSESKLSQYIPTSETEAEPRHKKNVGSLYLNLGQAKLQPQQLQHQQQGQQAQGNKVISITLAKELGKQPENIQIHSYREKATTLRRTDSVSSVATARTIASSAVRNSPFKRPLTSRGEDEIIACRREIQGLNWK
eukprot:TRINITY_DN5416_c0_g1_i4.p1 TRINITY_DN5416_c0_g1~~TRINITY_DN5416_c0_g1_i4.p1  ORF type:complete len:481 (-),score=97.59 TRINITY_DN5416_c0_g1_i4:61-1446(-)